MTMAIGSPPPVGPPTGPGALHSLLSPRSVGVIGAMGRHGSAGYETVRALRDYGFTGRLHPVNGSGRPVCGVPAHRSLAGLPGPIDLLVVALPPGRVPNVLREAGRQGVRTALVLSRSSAAGHHPDQASEIRRVAREHGILLAGPNSLGVIDTDPRVRLDACLSPCRPAPGGLAMACRSGTVGLAMLEHAARSGGGLASFVSLGDSTDVSAAALVAHWRADPRVRAIALCLDSVGDPASFARAARATARSKPVLVIPGGAPAPPESLLAHAGVIAAAGLDEMMDAARLLADQPLPAGRRLGIVGNAGGLDAIAARIARAAGFRLAQSHLLDVGVDADPRRMADAVETVTARGEVDIVLVTIAGTRANVPDAILTAVGRVVDGHPQVTAAAVLTGCANDIHHIGARRAPVYRQHDRAIRALAHAVSYAAWRRQPPGRRVAGGRVEGSPLRLAE
jgi:acyl-CoA synthetase (NDP forming)